VKTDASSSVGPKRAKQLLIVDDEPDVRLLLKDCLTSFGFAVSTAKDGSEGLRLIKTLSPDGVILDYQLPDLLGLDVLRLARAHGYQQPIIIVSGRLSEREMRDATRLGAAAVVRKPFQIAELEGILATLVGPAESPS